MINDTEAAKTCEYEFVPGEKRVVTSLGMRHVTVLKEPVTCGAAAETVDLVNGFRCVDHPPRWEQSYAQWCRAQGRHGWADAYRRTFIAMLTTSVLERHLTPPRVEEEAA